jgi:hypothetical protein
MNEPNKIDEFWDCCDLLQSSRDISFLVPNEKLDEGIGLSLDNSKYPYKVSHHDSFKTYVNYNDESDDNDEIIVSIREIRGLGVMDNIGGEIWEASYLLFAYILLNYKEKNYLDSRILEIGCGCGVPSMALIELMKKHRNSHKSRSITMTDNDNDVINNLRNLLSDSYGVQSTNENGDDKIVVEVGHLDWTSYQYRIDDNNNEVFDIMNSQYSNDKFDIIIGAACVYAPIHSNLADVIKYFLSGDCREVIIIQIGDRPGFQNLCQRLQLLNVMYTVDVISQDIYDLSQMIRVEKENNNMSFGEEEIIISKKISYQLNGNIRNSKPTVVTNRESFVILKAFK